MSDLSNEDLQIKLAFLERHLEEQDKAMYAMQGELEQLRRKIATLQQRFDDSSRSSSGELPANERPPHY